MMAEESLGDRADAAVMLPNVSVERIEAAGDVLRESVTDAIAGFALTLLWSSDEAPYTITPKGEAALAGSDSDPED